MTLLNSYKVNVHDTVTYWYNNDGKYAGLLHRVGSPAIEWWNGDQEWYIDGQRHREDGPAVISKDGVYRAWYLNDKQYSEWDHAKAVKALHPPVTKDLTVGEISKLLGYDVRVVKG